MPSSPALPPLREVVARHGLMARHALGQNFLFDEQLLSRLAAIPGSLEGQQVFEVGPGPGGLTRALLRAGARVTAVERDARFLPALAELADHFPGCLNVVEGDAQKNHPGDLIDGPYHIVANLPYNVGTALFTDWLESPEWPPRWLSLTLMFQREVAERIAARPGTSQFGRLAILSQWRSRAELSLLVHRSAFVPPPKVMSAVVHVVPGEQPAGVDPALLSRLTAAAFGQRRKMLRQSLKSVPGALEALSATGIDPTARPEMLTIEQFVGLARTIGAGR